MALIPGIRRVFRLDRAVRRAEQDVDDEIAFHFAETVDRLVASGYSPERARAEAERRFGDVERYRAELGALGGAERRAARRAAWWEGVAQDLRQAARVLRRQPGFATAVALTFALGIGANATMFGLVDRLVLRPPAHVAAPEELREIGQWVTFGTDTFMTTGASYPTISDLRELVPELTHIAGHGEREMSLGRGAGARRVRAGIVTGDFFALLGTRPVIGRLLQPADDRRDAGDPAVVLGHGFWRRELGGDPDVIGRTLRIDRGVYTVVGVAPEGFTGLERAPADVWLPAVPVALSAGEPGLVDSYGWLHFTAVGRLRSGVAEQAATERATMALRAIARQPDAMGDSTTVAALRSVLPRDSISESADAKVALLLGGVSLLVLLIACANVANLLLARALRRRREIAVRLALGVGRGRLVRQLVAESVLLAALGGVAALAVVYWGGTLLRALLWADAAWEGSPVDGRVLAFTAVATLVTGLLAGLLPALQASRPALSAALKLGARDGGGRQSRTRAALLVTQAALSVVLLVGTGLFTRSLVAVGNERLGYDVGNVLVGNMNLRGVGYDGARIEALHADIAERVRALPGVAGVAVAASLPFRSSYATYFRIPGRDSLPEVDDGGPYVNAVSPDFLATVGTRVLRGRGFSEADRAGSQRVMIVNQSMAKLFWPDGDALGACVKVAADSIPCATVVGIVENARRQRIEENTSLQYMVPLGQHVSYLRDRVLFVRPAHGADRATLAAAVRRTMQTAAPDLPFADVYPMADLLDRQMRPWRMGAALFGAFGALALVLAAVGLYGVIAYSVSQRTHELGVRLALGARQGQVRALVLRQGVLLAATGTALGVALAWTLAPRVSELLFRTSPRDPAVFAGVAAMLLVVAVAACILPAWRASRVDPAVALRAE
ncbi:MAG TPA: ABC transporter permease [Gemmatimonadales bacterium]